MQESVRFVGIDKLIESSDSLRQDLVSTFDISRGQLCLRESLGDAGNINELVEAEAVKLEYQVVWLQLLRLVEQSLGVHQVREGAVAPHSLERRDGRWLNRVSILVCLDSVLVSSRSHEQIARVNVDHRVLGVRQNQPLEVQEGQVVVTN